MSLRRSYATRARDYFRVDAPRLAIDQALGRSVPRATGARGLILDLQWTQAPPRETSIEGKTVTIVPFPIATQAIVSLALDETEYAVSADDAIDVFVPRAPFDTVADEHGTERIATLPLHPGMAVGDSVMFHLGACLAHATEPAAPSNPAVIDQIAMALNSHLALKYGGMRPPPPPANGSLSPWQLRLARARFNRNLDGGISLEEIADDCGLSVSHFSRAFSRSTGLAPHRWLTQRRIEIAKDLVLDGVTPLAQIALDCGFSDQSHFTRVFSNMTGLTPGRWRAVLEGQHARVRDESCTTID